jgi:FkbM family methyltransferase
MANRPAVRSLAERLTHRLVVARRLPPPFETTRIYVSSEGGLKYLRPSLACADPALTNLVAEVVRPGSVVWDVGANVGLFTFAAACAATASGTVVAFEPDTWLVGLLRRSARLAGRATDRAAVEIVPAAVCASIGLERFHVASRNRATSHLAGFGHDQTGGTRFAQLVPAFTLDHLLAHLPAPDVLKIDVEGAEQTVLEGGSQMLAEVRPTIICEVAAPNADPVGALLRAQGYRIVDGELAPPARRPLTSAPWSTLAVPEGTPDSARPVPAQVTPMVVRT